jgi:uncharacterized protein
MSQQVDAKLSALGATLESMRQVAVAVSGGVDSVTLAAVAHRRLGANATMFHAVSPAVPPEATERTRRHARQFGWHLEVVDAGEFSDPDYLSNPVNRCFYCKSSLYGTIARNSNSIIVSGTNLDDLADYRPGLQAASEQGVRHPYVESRIDKATVRAIAGKLQLEEIADLPASPCLSSRLETGISVDVPTLRLVHAVEKLIGGSLRAETVRCRVRRSGLAIELDCAAYERVLANDCENLRKQLESLCATCGYHGPTRFEPYRMGSAFLRDK